MNFDNIACKELINATSVILSLLILSLGIIVNLVSKGNLWGAFQV
jgi:hypothetical protein